MVAATVSPAPEALSRGLPRELRRAARAPVQGRLRRRPRRARRCALLAADARSTSRGRCRRSSRARSRRTHGTRCGSGAGGRCTRRSRSPCWPSRSAPTPASSACSTRCCFARCPFTIRSGWRRCTASGRRATGFHEWRQQSAYLADAALYDTLDVNVEGVQPGGPAARWRRRRGTSSRCSARGRSQGRASLPARTSPGRNARRRHRPRPLAAALRRRCRRHRLHDPRQRRAADHRRRRAAGLRLSPEDRVWTPTTFDYERIPKTGSVIFWTTIGRLKPALTWAQARQAFEAEAFATVPKRRRPDAVNRPALIPLQEQLAGPIRNASLMLMGGVATAAAARVRQRRQPAAGAHGRALERAGDPHRARRQPRPPHAAAADRNAPAVAGRHRRRPGGRALDRRARRAASSPPRSRARPTRSRLARARLRRRAVDRHRAGLRRRSGALRQPRRARARGPTATRGHAAHADARPCSSRAQIAVTIVLLTGSVALGRAFLALLRVDNGYQVRLDRRR